MACFVFVTSNCAQDIKTAYLHPTGASSTPQKGWTLRHVEDQRLFPGSQLGFALFAAGLLGQAAVWQSGNARGAECGTLCKHIWAALRGEAADRLFANKESRRA